MEETEASYQCTGYYNHEPLNSTTYNVSLTQGIKLYCNASCHDMQQTAICYHGICAVAINNYCSSLVDPGGSGAGQSSPVVIVDGPAGVLEVGEWLNLTCYILNSEGLQLQWLKDGQILSTTESELIALTIFTS